LHLRSESSSGRGQVGFGGGVSKGMSCTLIVSPRLASKPITACASC
jgi:hypothetical protein